MTDKRTTYKMMREWIYNSYYQTCRGKIAKGRGWLERESEFSYAFYQSESDIMFDTDLERVMWDTLWLIIDCGRESDECRDEIKKLVMDVLDRHNIVDLVSGIPTDEADELMYDLKILKLID
jgi:hypothetical protein